MLTVVAMAMPGYSPSLVLTRNIIPSRFATKIRKVGSSSRGLETDRFVVRSGSQRQESTLRGAHPREEEEEEEEVTHWSIEAAAEGANRALNLVLASVFCYGVAAVGAVPETETRGASFFDVAHVSVPSADASGLLQMPPARLVNRCASILSCDYWLVDDFRF